MKTFLEQPRRGKTREALITPHKRSAVWGLKHETGSDCGYSDNDKRSAVWGLTQETGTDCGVNDNDKRSAVWGKARTAIAELCCIIVMAVLCTACDRDRQALTGDYSYKLSGEVELTDEDGAVTYRLIHRNGQMNILRDKSDKDRYIITMNEMTGGCYTMNAALHGDSLLIDSHSFNTNILSTSSIPDLNIDLDLNQDEEATIVYRISAAGSGTVNGNILILREVWDGTQSGNSSVTISGPEMTIIAEKN